MTEITLSKAVRSNLLNLQSTATLLSKSQERLSSGLRVNSALDNPTNFFTAQGLNSRANDLSQLSDAVSNAVQTVAAADKGITAITKLVESAQATARQALQTAQTVDTGDTVIATTTTSDFSDLTIAAGTAKVARVDGGAFSALDVSGGGSVGFSLGNDTSGFGITIDEANLTIWGGEMGQSFDASNLSAQDVADILTHVTDGDVPVTVDGGRLVINSVSTGTSAYAGVYVVESGLTGGTTGLPTSTQTAYGSPANTAGDVTINGQTISLADDDRADDILQKFQDAASAATGTDAFSVSIADGELTITGTGGNDLVIGGDAGTLSILGLSDTTIAGEPGGQQANPKRAELVSTYNDLLDQIDALAKDASFNGVNLLNGDSLSVLFNEDGSSSISISGVTNTASGLGLSELTLGSEFNTNAGVNGVLDDLKGVIDTLRGQSAKFGSNLSVVETRQDFTKSMINVLQTGAANLTLADSNEEAANVLALQTRQQLSSTALSLASQADQNVLRLF